MDRDQSFSIRELAAEFGISPRTIHRYVSLGMLPPPTKGGDARHPYETWRRLNEIRKGQERCRSRADWADVFNPAPD